MVSELYKKDNYLNRNINKLFNSTIIEYDLHSANTSLCREYNLLDEDLIENIEDMSKEKRVVTIGKLQRKDKDFKEKLKSSFVDIRKRFFIENNIQDEDVLSIKKDAIFLLKYVDNTKFGYCEFLKKNKYTSYLFLNNLEFYYNRNLDDIVIDVKGISDDVLDKHKGYMLDFFGKFFYKMENNSMDNVLQYIKIFISKYKNNSLDINYYREFNSISGIKVLGSDNIYDNATFVYFVHRSSAKEIQIDITYNYFNLLIPLIQLLI